MADRLVSELTEKTFLAATDELYVESGLNGRKISAENLAFNLQTLGGVINVKDQQYGATGDGVTDDTAAIQAAIDAFRTAISTTIDANGQPPVLVFPPLEYVITDTLDFTSIRAINWTVFAYGALIHAKTNGKPAIDMLDCRFWRIKGLEIYGDATLKPTFGIQFGRIDSTSAGDGTFEDIHMDGNFTVAGMYNFAAETVDYRHIRLYNDDTTAGACCYILDAQNEQNITSAFVTQTIPQGTLQSCNHNVFYTADIRKDNANTAIITYGNYHQLHFVNSYGAAVSDSLIEINKATKLEDVIFDMHVETTGIDHVITFDTMNSGANVVVSGLKYKDHRSSADVSLFDTTGTTWDLVIDNLDMEVSDPVNAVAIFGIGSAASDKFVTGIIRWSAATTLDLSNMYFCGIIIADQATTITDTLGTYQIIRRPNSSDSRIMEIKGRIRFGGSQNSATDNNYLEIAGGTTGNPEINAGGSSTDIDIPLTPKGTGRLRFGTHAAIVAETVTGYITIKDSAGTSRKIAVVS